MNILFETDSINVLTEAQDPMNHNLWNIGV